MEFLDFNGGIRELRDLSPTVDGYVSAELYRDGLSPDEILDNKAILNQCYLVLLQELKEVGVELHVDLEEGLGDFYSMEGYQDLYSFLLSDNLILYFENNELFKNKIDDIVSNYNDLEEDLLLIILEAFSIYHPHNTNFERVSRISDYIYSNESLKTHVKACIDESITKINLPEYSSSTIFTFITYINKGRLNYRLLIEMLINHDPKLDKEYLLHTVNNYDMEKITANNLHKFIWLVKNEHSDLNEKQQAYANKIKNSHARNNTHHIEYFISRYEEPSYENLVELACHHFEATNPFGDDSSNDIYNYKKGFDEMMELVNSSRLLESNVDKYNYLIKLRTVIISYLENVSQ